MPESGREDYESLRVTDLKRLLRQRGLRLCGPKHELVARLREADNHLLLEPSPVDWILQRGSRGPPVYDELGYELDIEEVAHATYRWPRRRTARGKKYWEMIERESREEDRKAEIMGMRKNDVSALSLMAWNDRIARDLDKLYHKITFNDFEEWHKRGFRAEPGEFVATNIPQSEVDRIGKLATGSSSRK